MLLVISNFFTLTPVSWEKVIRSVQFMLVHELNMNYTDKFFCIRHYLVSRCGAAEAHSEPSQRSKMELIAKTVNGCKPFTIFVKGSILNVGWLLHTSFC